LPGGKGEDIDVLAGEAASCSSLRPYGSALGPDPTTKRQRLTLVDP
jgi:hypothetical protein